MKKYTVKYWLTKKDYDKGDALTLGTDFTIEEAEEKIVELHFDGMYGVEYYETETGNTIYSSFE